jgi:hypothetical protein
MAEKGITLCPTIATLGSLMREPFDRFLTPKSHFKLKQVLGRGLQTVKKAEELGVTVLL